MTEKEDTFLETISKLAAMVKACFSKDPQRERSMPPAQPSPANNQDDATDIVETVPPLRKWRGSKAKMAGNISINGMSFQGDSINVTNGKVIIDGVNVSDSYKNSKTITIEVTGDVKKLSCDVCQYIKVTGDAGSIETTNGDVTCSVVDGSVNTMSGSVSCGHVNGDVETLSGSVTCGDVGGKVETMSGSIRRK